MWNSFSALRCPRYRRTLRLLIALFIFTCILHLSITANQPKPSRPSPLKYQPILWTPHKDPSTTRILKASILYPDANPIFASALSLHEAHNTHHGYEMRVLRTPIVKGFANKLYWLQSLIVQELQKKEGERAEWIVYTDPTLLLNNPNIPLQHFLPPTPLPDPLKSLCIITTKNPLLAPTSLRNTTNVTTTINPTLLILHTHPTTLQLLTSAIYNILTTTRASKAYLSYSHIPNIEAFAWEQALSEERYKNSVIYHPPQWYNHTAGLFLQASGDADMQRLRNLDDMLREGRAFRQGGQMRSEGMRTMYPSGETVRMFWRRVMDAKRVLEDVEDRSSEDGEGNEWVGKLRDLVEKQAWDDEEMDGAIEAVKQVLF